MNAMRLAAVGAAAAASAALVGAAVASPDNATLTIRHQVKGCHTWAFTGGGWKASQAITLARGAKLTVIDNDVMPHRLVQLSGPKAKLSTPAMRHMSARASVVFPAAGVYVLGTKAGEDYPGMGAVRTVGKDNVLRLVVTVK
jgi:hypothetical protein